MPRYESTQDPAAISARLSRVAGRATVLALDLGTNTGYSVAFHKPGDPVDPANLALTCGQVDLSAGPFDSGAIRFVRLRHFLSAVRPDLVVYEMVRNTPAGANKLTKYNAAALLARAMTSAQLFGAFQAHVCAWAEEHDVPCTSFPIGTIKKRATGKGSASKEAMITAANATFGLDLDLDGWESSGVDNVADAAWLSVLALEQYGSGLTIPEVGQDDDDSGAD